MVLRARVCVCLYERVYLCMLVRFHKERLKISPLLLQTLILPNNERNTLANTFTSNMYTPSNFYLLTSVCIVVIPLQTLLTSLYYFIINKSKFILLRREKCSIVAYMYTRKQARVDII